MVDSVSATELRLILSAQDVKELTGWPDPMVEDYLGILEDLIAFANAINEIANEGDDNRAALTQIFSRIVTLSRFVDDVDQIVSGADKDIVWLRAAVKRNEECCDDTRQELEALRALVSALAAGAAKKTTGWASYSDTTYTTGSPFTIASGVSAYLPNDAGTSITDYLPHCAIGTGFYDGTYITPCTVGDYYILTVRFTARHSLGLSGTFEFGVDIGGAMGVIFKQVQSMPKGAGNDNFYSLAVPFYSLDTFLANGGRVQITQVAGGTLSIFDIEYQVALVSPT